MKGLGIATYPGSTLVAGVIQAKSWIADVPDYKPTPYNSSAVLAEPAWADPPASVSVHSQKHNTMFRLKFRSREFTFVPRVPGMTSFLCR